MRLENLPYQIRYSTSNVRNDNSQAPNKGTQSSVASVATPTLLPLFSAGEVESSWFPQVPQFDFSSPVQKPHKKKKHHRFGHRLKKFFKKIVKPLKKIFAPIIKVLSKIPIVGQVISAVKVAVGQFKMWKSLFKGDWKEFGKNLWNVAKNAVGAMPFPGAQMVQRGMEIAENVYKSIKAGVKGQWGKMLSGIVSTVTNAVGGKGITGFFSDKLPKLTDFVKKAVDVGRNIKNTVTGFLDRIPEFGRTIISYFGSALTDKLSDNAIVSNISDLASRDRYDRAA
jgi:hypothetical protein